MAEDEQYPFAGLIGEGGRRQAILQAKRDYVQWSVPNTGDALVNALEEGWSMHRTLKTKTQLRKPKSHNDLWEQTVWSLIASYDFKHINNIHEKGKFNLNGTHQIDVFGIKDGLAVAIECKSKQDKSKQTIRKHILEISGYRKGAENKIKEAYGNNTQVAWAIATRNHIIPEKDRQLAKENDIALINEGQIQYFTELQKRTGLVSKFQLMAHLFGEREIPQLQETVPALKTKIGMYDAYIFAINPGKLLPISYISHRGNQSHDDINAFQRMVGKSRLKSIASYIKDSGGFFPNSLLINIDSRGQDAKYMPITKSDGVEFGALTLPGHFKTAWIIDGQHRLLAFADTPQKDTLLVPVIAFHDLEPRIQANMFVDINNKQKKVTQNIIIELNATLKWGSPKPKEMLESLHAKTMMYLNQNYESPLNGLIALTGDKKKGRPFTTNTIVTAISRLNLFGKVEKKTHVPGKFWVIDNDRKRTLEKSCELAYETISSYLRVFEQECENWNVEISKDEGAFVMTNQGISAILLVMGDLIEEYCRHHMVEPRDYSHDEIIEWIRPWMKPMIEYINSADINKLNELRSKYGLQGQSEIKFILEGEINKSSPDFNPVGLEKELKKISNQWKHLADKIVDEMEEAITSNIISLLKLHYGDEGDTWFMEGVPLETQKKVANKALENKETYANSFDIVHWKNVVSSKSNYSEIFESTYSLKNYPERGDKSKEKTLSWFNRLNDIRKKTKHPVGKRVYEKEYLELKQIWSRLRENIQRSNDEMI
tara:strand:+ start:145 stop:2454 length:2310 start_codon:yes stop_codon:yes gene_type:complete